MVPWLRAARSPDSRSIAFPPGTPGPGLVGGGPSSCCPACPAPLPGIYFRGHAAWNLLQYFCSKQHVKLIDRVLNLFLLWPEIRGDGSVIR